MSGIKISEEATRKKCVKKNLFKWKIMKKKSLRNTEIDND